MPHGSHTAHRALLCPGDKPMADSTAAPTGQQGMESPGGQEGRHHQQGPPHLGIVAPKAAVPLKRVRPRMASGVSVASTSVAAKLGGLCSSPGLY